MEQVTDVIGNPTTILIERVFWLALGGFFGLALLKSVFRKIREDSVRTNNINPNQLKNLAKKAIQKNG